MTMDISLFLADEEATKHLGEDIALVLKAGDGVALVGDLGAGKSTLARAIIRTLADDDSYEVPSPTFTLVQHYDELYLPVAHVDLYRITDAVEVRELALQEYLADGVVLIEWPQKGDGFLPTLSLRIEINHEKAGRQVIISGHDDAIKRVQRSFEKRRFLEINGRCHAKRRYLTGDASARSYETIWQGDFCEILMDAPKVVLQANGQGDYARTVHLSTDIGQFVAIDRLLLDQGFKAPEIHAVDYDAGLLLCEDLGQTGIRDEGGAPIVERYLESAAFLSVLHQKEWPQTKKWDDLECRLFVFDEKAMAAELALLMDWYKPYQGGKDASEAEKVFFFSAWAPYFKQMSMAEQSLILRDFHSPNILWQDAKTGVDQIGVIDFQDAMIGTTAYDMVSLAQDARVTIDEKTENELVAHYGALRQAGTPDFNMEAFRYQYAIAGAQRASKIMGGFVRLKIRDNKPVYMNHLPRIIDYLKRNLSHPRLASLRHTYQELGVID